jgi:DNA-binding NarL/FixJ family response regulator
VDNKLRVLHVDDDVVMGMEIKEFLEAEGYEVCDTVCTGPEAIRSARAHRPDVVLMDIKLKGAMDGIETIREIRSFSDTSVIFLSGYKDAGTVEKAAAIENALFVSKPFDFFKLTKAIESFRKNKKSVNFRS